MKFVNAWTVADCKISVSHVKSHGNLVVQTSGWKDPGIWLLSKVFPRITHAQD